MKKIFSIVALSVALFAVNAAKAQGNIHAGYVQNNIISTTTVPIVNTTTHDTLSRPGVYVGYSYNINLTNHLGLFVGANLEYFAKNDSTVIAGKTLSNRKFQQLDLVVPVHINYAIPFGTNNNFTLFAGPTFGLGLINRTTTSILGSDPTVVNHFDNTVATEEQYYRERLTWSLTGGFCVNFGGFGIHAGYTYGMSDNFTSANTKGTSKRIFVGANINF